MYGSERKEIIIKMLNTDGHVYVNELSQLLKTSKETIRRDLRELEGENKLLRTHGGAAPLPSSPSPLVPFPAAGNFIGDTEEPISVRQTYRMPEKNRICKKAASFIEDHDTIFVDNSSTTLFLAKYIPTDMRVTIITNSIKFLLETASLGNPNLTLICLAGFYNASNLSLYGSRTIKSAEDFFPKKSYISCAGISPTNKIADTSLSEIDTRRTILQKTETTFLLADHTKFYNTAPFYLTDFNSIDYMITDKQSFALDLDFVTQKSNIKIINCDE